MRNRGFTLIEIMVGTVVALLVIGVVMATFLSQQRSMQGLDLAREASNASRDAMLSLQGTIGRAGYGIDPRYAFDFRNYNCADYSGPTSASNACRDRVAAADELVFVERDPNYYWAGTPTTIVRGCDDATARCSGHAWQVTGFTSVSPYEYYVNARVGDVFRKGQLVLITCGNGLAPQIATLSTTVGPVTTAGSVTLRLAAPVTDDHYTDAIQGTAGSPFHDICYDGSGAVPNNAAPGVSLFLVNRYRYFVTNVNGEPWLMLDRGIDYNGNGAIPENGGDANDLIPIARGVEGFQVSYLLRPDPNGTTTAPDNNTNWVIGDSPGVVEEPNPFATAPLQNTQDTDPVRFNLHPANIRGVRLRLTVRSLQADNSQNASWPGDAAVLAPATSIENRNDFTAVTLGRFRRFFTSVVIATPNLNSKDPFIF